MIGIEQLKGLNKQHYVVLRPLGEVNIVWEKIRLRLHNRFLDMPITYPHAGHMMLRGFPDARIVKLRKSLLEWSNNIGPLKIGINKLTVLSEPSKVVILKIKKTPQLVRAFITLAEATAQFARFSDDRTVDEWIFHMSLLYCGDMTAEEWKAVLKYIKTVKANETSCEVNEVELVSYSNLSERIETFTLKK